MASKICPKCGRVMKLQELDGTKWYLCDFCWNEEEVDG